MQRIGEAELILNKDQSVYHLNLRPEHIADTVITVGDPGRVHHISKHFEKIEFEMNKREFVTHVGTYKGKRLTVISTGMGTDNIEILMNELDAAVNINLKTRTPNPTHKSLNIIRVGTSGALQENLGADCHLVSVNGIGFDTLSYFYDLPQSTEQEGFTSKLQQELGLGFRPYMAAASQKLVKQIGFDMVKGNTITCPGFYAPQGRKLRLTPKLSHFIRNAQRFNHQNQWLTNLEMETAGYYLMGQLLGHEVLSVNAIIANRVSNKFSPNPAKTVDDLIVKVLERL